MVGRGFAGYTVDGATGEWTLLSSPTAVAVDRAGDVYVADAGNYLVRRFGNESGLVYTVAG